MSFINAYKPPLRGTVDISFKEPYDVNSEIPVPPLLETERVQLVPFIPAVHAAPFHQAFIKADESVFGQHLPFTWPTLESFLTFLEEFIRQDTASAVFAVIDKTRPPSEGTRILNGQVAGAIGWLHGAPQSRSLEIGPVIILPAFQRTFVSANAIGLILKYVLDLPEQGGLGYRRVQWCASPLNQASVGAAEKMGFVMEGVIRWLWVLQEGRKGRAVPEEEESRGRGKGDGRDSVVLGICWDDWVSGVRELVERRMSRV